MERLDLEGIGVTPERVEAAISRAKNDMVGPKAYANRGDADHVGGGCRSRVSPLSGIAPGGLGRRLRRPAAAPGDDPQGAPEGSRATLDARFRFVLVDEYQDTNLAQYAILQALSVDLPNLCVTGDPDQSIYGWRGANLSNILEFEHDYAGCRVVKLERNYRSTKNILRVADHLIRFNRRRKAKVADDREPRRDAGRSDRLRDRGRRGGRGRRQDPRTGAGWGPRLPRRGHLLPGHGPDPPARAGISGGRRSRIRSSVASRSTNVRRSRTSSRI